MNKIQEVFKNKQKDILNIYFTAGYPQLNDTAEIIRQLDKAGVDLIELGIPYSDPLADGSTIQESSRVALDNGITLQLVIDQVREVRKTSNIPIIIMGYYNQFLQYGMEKLIGQLAEIRIDGMIIPDLPMDYYNQHYKKLFEDNDIGISFLITPETSSLRVRQADNLSQGFIYVVAQSSITGGQNNINKDQVAYFERLEAMHLKTPTLIGFGIHNRETFIGACKYSNGAIIGSAFIRMLRDKGIDAIPDFINSIRGN
jgi:tryptophan synthase alpha chain